MVRSAQKGLASFSLRASFAKPDAVYSQRFYLASRNERDEAW